MTVVDVKYNIVLIFEPVVGPLSYVLNRRLLYTKPLAKPYCIDCRSSLTNYFRIYCYELLLEILYFVLRSIYQDSYVFKDYHAQQIKRVSSQEESYTKT